ncbi:potassium transporter TrkA [Palaeococcus pacificus DY20341]|uniref:Potassium transporter TrkA n=1 Tax=Palaeococcus pacificus DY20341 TaxID=1343739 RepID=A0A075M0E1_9EURY|nr:TrkA family potassium uptake protein [Palaeococcus pacificus]AIF70253.1 potassium transporter TrkA [Palaeococcus pacificus DY20341]
MFVVVMGAGRVGFLVSKMLESEGHDVTIIESNKEKAKELANLINGLVINGDATNQSVLEEANIKQADAFAALTGQDDANLLACILAKHLNPNITTILRVSNIKNKQVFEQVEDLKKYFDYVVSPEEMAANYIFRTIVTPGFDRVMLPKEGAEIVQFSINSENDISEKLVKELGLPRDSLIVAVYDEKGNLIIPSGETKLPKKGQVIIFARDKALEEIKKIFEKKRE